MSSAILLPTRTSFLCGSPAAAMGRSDSGGELSSSASFHRCCSTNMLCPKQQRKEGPLLRRARSEADILRSSTRTRSVLLSPAPVQPKVVEEEEERKNKKDRMFDLSVGVWPRAPATVVVDEEEDTEEYSDGGTGEGRKNGGRSSGGNRSGRGGDQSNNERIKEYYQKMLQSDPSNPLLLRNYGRFLHEVAKDMEGAEEQYGRAILASPADGEVLSLYAKLVWETCGDGKRAEAYFKRAAEASPDDCFVLGSYARFLWDAEEEEEKEEEAEGIRRAAASPSTMVEAF